ncbi:phosphodiester glycosidase family protein [Hoeflea sp.]|uniref:phosphodiester glycosidase family protein n=1 Tax=Hoeflea sp. TaxID=1940281 RepID=UPI003B01CBBD
MTSFRRLFIASTFVALAGVIAGNAPAVAQSCQSESFEDDRYIVCGFDLTDTDIRLFWQQPGGGPYATFSTLANALDLEGMRLEFAMNGGMYGDDFSPIGLHVEDGQTLRAADTATSSQRPEPNFYKKPNGIFYIGSGTAGVMTTEAYLSSPPGARFATQSGPMLVIDGDLHPAFIVDSNSRKQRNGVCAPTPTEVRFVISDGRVNFHDFGRFVRDHLGCENALFLDGGSAPGIYAPKLGRDDPPGHGGYGPIIGVVGTK